MANKVRPVRQRVNWYDGQNVTENDLDTEQLYHSGIASDIVDDFHGSGIINKTPFENRVLLNTLYPGYYAETENPSKLELENGTYDGKGIQVDRQPSDNVYGNRIQVTLENVNIIGRISPKILIVGRTFNGTDSAGILNFEFLEFESNTTKVTKNFYQKIIAVFFNNFSGGTGKTEQLSSIDSYNLISKNSGYAIFAESEPLKVFAAPVISSQTLSPCYDMINFISSSVNKSITEEIEEALDSTSSISELYFDLDTKEELIFDSNSKLTLSYGQKFLSHSDNLQRIDLLLSVTADTTRDSGQEYDWSGDLVLSVYELSKSVKFSTDVVPDDLIGFDPVLNPVSEISLNQSDLEDLGYKLNNYPQIVSFNFSNTILADPQISPSLKPDSYYAFLLSRRGNNQTGTIVVNKGYDNTIRKQDLGLELSIYEQFSKQESRFLEFDPVNEKYLDDNESALWYKIYSNTIEVLDGSAYTHDGSLVTIPKYQDYVGQTQISYFKNMIPLVSIGSDSKNYVILESQEQFSKPTTHDKTGNLVYSRIANTASINVLNSDDLATYLETDYPLLLAKVIDNNVRDAAEITGTFDLPGLINQSNIIFINPSTTLQSLNLIGRVIIPDVDCTCTASYRIIDAILKTIIAGDLDNSGKITAADLTKLISLTGNTINSSVTEKSILNGDLELLDFTKADLNNDGSIDGDDIKLIEDAVDGYVNFSIPHEITVLELTLENIISESNFPIIFTDTAASGYTNSTDNTIVFNVSSEMEARSIRTGNYITIPSDSDDAGRYLITSKTLSNSDLTVTVEVSNIDDSDVSFIGTSNFNVVVTSDTVVNTYADNLNLLKVPFQDKSYSIIFANYHFTERFIDVCDLRRFIETTFIEETVDSDLCGAVSLLECTPVYKNQYYFPGDIYIPNGQIYKSPGVLYQSDYEYVNVIMPLPAGSISDCSLNLYESFAKIDSDGLTAAGYPALKYSDGTYVGCTDTSSTTDISLNRIKFSSGISSLYVDAFIDGYAVDGYADSTVSVSSSSLVSENYLDFEYNSFSDWVEDPLNDVNLGTITANSGGSEPAIFDINTISSSTEKYLRIKTPAESQNFEADFIIEFKANRIAWPNSSLIAGTVSSFAKLVITNSDGAISTLKIGWKSVAGSDVKLFYSGIIEDTDENIIDSFEYTTEAPDTVGDDLLFRIKRIDDAIFVYYIIPTKIGDSTSIFGEYIRLGQNPDTQPGAGTVIFTYEINQSNTPTSSLNFIVYLQEVEIKASYSAEDGPTSDITLSRDNTTLETNDLILAFPLSLNSRTNVISATLSFTAKTSITISDEYNIIPLDIPNVGTLSSSVNIPQTQNTSLITTFIPGSLISGSKFTVDITDIILNFLSQSSHLPGFYKGLIIKPSISADSSFNISSSIDISIEYEEITTGVVFEVGMTIDPLTGIANFKTKNILYDSLIEEHRTIINFGIHLKKSGFINSDLSVSSGDLVKIGLGTCQPDEVITSDSECFFIVGSDTGRTSLKIEGPWPCLV